MRVYKAIEIAVSTNILNRPIIFSSAGGIASTDGSVIYIDLAFIRNALRRVWNEKAPEDLRERIFNEVIDYLVAHECMHILFSDMDAYGKYTRYFEGVFGTKLMLLFRTLANILEDMRVEYLLDIHFPALIDLFREGRKILCDCAIEHYSLRPNKFTKNERLILALLRFLQAFAILNSASGSLDIISREYGKQIANKVWDMISEFVPLIILTRISKNRLISMRTAASIAVSLHEIIENLSQNSQLIQLLRDISRKSTRIYIKGKVREVLKGRQEHATVGTSGARHAAPSLLTPVISDIDYRFYRRTISIYSAMINKLQTRIIQALRRWRETKNIYGDFLEDHLVELYAWSMTKDEPRPKIFNMLDTIIIPLDVLVLLDQSGSMLYETERVAESAVVISEALKPLVEDGFVRLGIAGFGDSLIYYKRVCWPYSITRIIPRSEGGTMIFSAIERFFESEKDFLRSDAYLLIIVFTDSYDCEEDLPLAEEVRSRIKRFNFRSRIVGFITEAGYDKDFVSKIDCFTMINSVMDVPDALIEFLLDLIRRRRISKMRMVVG